VFTNNEQNETVFDQTMANIDDDDEYEEGDEIDASFACRIVKQKHEQKLMRHFDEEKDLPTIHEDESGKSGRLETTTGDRDGAILKNEETFDNEQNISPILKSHHEELDVFPNESYRESVKRKRPEEDSLDNISFMSVESTKKPKLFRGGSITKGLRRRMSFGIATPINNMFRKRSASTDATNTSICSNFETTFNESIKEPIKEKYRQLKDSFKISKGKKDSSTPKSTKTKIRMVSANLSNMKDVCNVKTSLAKTPEKFEVEFKTPKALSFPSSSKSKPRFDELNLNLNETVAERVFIHLPHTHRHSVIEKLMQFYVFPSPKLPFCI
jgi:hypothetical protein